MYSLHVNNMMLYSRVSISRQCSYIMLMSFYRVYLRVPNFGVLLFVEILNYTYNFIY